MTRTCVDCGRSFQAGEDEGWKTRCLVCFKRRKRAEERGDYEPPGWKRPPPPPPESAAQRLTKAAAATVAEAFAAGRAEGYEAGRARGYDAGMEAGRRQRPATLGQLDAALVRELVGLCHPDRHPPERFRQANDATAKLLGLLGDGARRVA